MLLSQRNSILTAFTILACTSVAQAQSNADIAHGAVAAMENALKDPKKVRMLECIGVSVYTVPPANWKAPSKAECDEFQKSADVVASDQPASDMSARRIIDIQLGSLRVTRLFADQPIALANSGKAIASEVMVECGFFAGNELRDTARGIAEQVLPGQTAYISIASATSNGVTSAKCRIVKWR